MILGFCATDRCSVAPAPHSAANSIRSPMRPPKANISIGTHGGYSRSSAPGLCRTVLSLGLCQRRSCFRSEVFPPMVPTRGGIAFIRERTTISEIFSLKERENYDGSTLPPQAAGAVDKNAPSFQGSILPPPTDPSAGIKATPETILTYAGNQAVGDKKLPVEVSQAVQQRVLAIAIVCLPKARLSPGQGFVELLGGCV